MTTLIRNSCITIVSGILLLGCSTGSLLTETESKNYALINPGDSPADIIHKAATITPSPRQYEWQKLEFTAFIHFGINTFTGREWGDGTEDPALFNPTEFDADQWMEVLKDAGVRLVVLTTKHHDGFCLWPSEYTEHDVENSPWRDGKGDVVREVAEAAREAGLKFGVYLSPWDRHEPSYGNSDEYNEYFKNQLRELLTNYGKIDEVWFDGAKGDNVNQEYDWDGYYSTVRTLQPEAVIAVRGPDVRWVGTESGYGRETEWSVVPGGEITDMEKVEKGLVVPPVDRQAEDLGSREVITEAKSLFWYPSEVDVSIRPGWFYHESQDKEVKSLNKMLDIYYSSVGRNSVLLLNIPPDKRGLIHEEDAERLREMRRVLDQTFDVNLATDAAADVSAGSTMLDGDIETHWMPEMVNGAAIELDLGAKQTFNRLMLQENILVGQRVERFRVEARTEGKWQKIAEGTTIGYKRLLRFPAVTTDRVRLVIEQARMRPAIAEFGLFKAPEVLSDPIIRRGRKGFVHLSTESKDPEIFYTLDGSDPTAESRQYREPFALPDGGTVKARAYISNREKFSDVIESTFDKAKAKWKIVHADDEVRNYEGAKAIDSDPGTMWHTPWQDKEASHPHELVIDLGESLDLKGFTYLPRQDGNISGTTYTYRVYVSANGEDWGEPTAEGTFGNIRNNPIRQFVHFDEPVEGRYLRFEALDSVIEDENWTSVAEIGIITR